MAIVWIIFMELLCIEIASCEFNNVAKGKPVKVSSKHDHINPNRAVDGNTTATYPDGVMHTETGKKCAWWTVDVQLAVRDATVKIYFRTDYKARRYGVQLYTSLTPFSTYPGGQWCHTFTGNAIPDVSSMNCPGTWRYLMVYTEADTDGNGPVLDFGEVEILVCADGWYGNSCDKQCNCAVQSQTCNRDTGACPPGGCLPGYQGSDCSQSCQVEFNYGANCIKLCDQRKCTGTGTSCNVQTGRCPGGCAPGGCFTGEDCLECYQGYYGNNCEKQCQLRQCTVTPETCYRYSANCPDGGCHAGYQDPECYQPCNAGTYGQNCVMSCNARKCQQLSPSCDAVSGSCSPCTPGYGGTDCSECSSDNYGENCDKLCSSRHCQDPDTTCERLTGRCPGGCQAGWMETDCVTECSGGSYGAGCTGSCSSRQCLTPSDLCHHVTGNCSSGCKSGWMGIDCKQNCTANKYGENCDKTCSNRRCNMPKSAVCDGITGRCPDGCEIGWTGIDCSTQCPVGTYGSVCTDCSGRHCGEDQTCPLDGSCSQGCQSGWKGDTCTETCPTGFYGVGCNSSCGMCSNSNICDHISGNCSQGCETGMMPGLCQTSCASGTYGDNCRLTCGHCNDTCDPMTGHCPGGCNNGYTGDMCIEQLPQISDASPDYVPAVAGVVVGILVIAVIVIAIIVFRRRRGAGQQRIHKDVTNSTTQVSTGSADKKAKQNAGNMYVNVAMVAVETPKSKEKPFIHEKPAVREKPKRTISVANSQSKAPVDQEEEIVDEEESAPKRDYYNVDDTVVVREVSVGELTATIQQIKSQEGGFETEYSRLPNGFTAPYDDSQKPENFGKNKFRGYYPYNHNRVRLSLLPDIPGSDYINASLMHSHNQRKTYIAAQAPNKKTVGDFWRMIWEHRCGRVIMLTGLVEAMKEKCYQYWSDIDDMQTDHHKIEVDVTDTRAHYTVRHLKVTSKHSGECRSVVQYHFASWPDHGVPDTLALVHFIWMIRQTDTQTDGSLLVHCSAGIGRTGTYIAVDSLLDQVREDGVVDVLGYVSVMRGQRKNMIQTKEQYECVFHCLVEMTKFGNTSMDVENFTTSYSSRGMDSMVDRKTLRELTQMMLGEDRTENTVQNRMWVDGNKNFMVRIGPTLRYIRGYLMAVVPPPGLEKLLWKLVEENNVHNIIIISQLQENLVGDKGSRKKCGSMTLTTTGQTNLDSDLSMMTLELQEANTGDIQNVKIFKLNGSATLDSMSSCLLNHAHLQHLSGEITPTVIVHSESDRECAVTLSIMGNILSGIMEDHRVDVIGHVRTYLKGCPELTFSEQEVKKLLDFAKDFIQMITASNTYANL